MSLGLESGRVALSYAHQAWAEAFTHERKTILEALSGHATVVEHVGSTAIPGVPAKPILDILVGVLSFENARVCVGPMESLGYEYRGEYGISRRHYFVKGSPRTHHVHMLEVDGETWSSMIAFRDALLADADVAREYVEAKIRLAAAHGEDRTGYQQAKDQVVERILTRVARHD